MDPNLGGWRFMRLCNVFDDEPKRIAELRECKEMTFAVYAEKDDLDPRTSS
jgi:hypothetical protein